MFSRLFPRPTTTVNSNNNNDASVSATPENSSRREPDPCDEQTEEEQQSILIPSSPLIQTTDGKTVVRLYFEILGCEDLGPDYTEDGKRNAKTYNPYIKVKLGGNDNKDSLEIHKTKAVQQRFDTRNPMFDHSHDQSCFCIDGMAVEQLLQGLMFKVKDAAATASQKKLKLDVLGWALVQSNFLLKNTYDDMDRSASQVYQEDLNYTLEFELIHPVHLVTGFAGKIHLVCRPATDQEVNDCRKNGMGYFRPYTSAKASPDDDENLERALTPPLREVL